MYPKTFFETSQLNPRSRECFIVMPFAEKFREVYGAIAEALKGPELRLSCLRTDDLRGGGAILQDILQGLGQAEVVIADVTSRNPNVFYELGIAHMAKDIKKVLILTQDMNDVPFDLRQFRCMVYQQTPEGLRELQKELTLTMKELIETSYPFAIKQQQPYKFPHQFMGSDRCFYDFVPEVLVALDAVKFHMNEYRHILGQPTQTIREKDFGILREEKVDLVNIPWQLVLEKTDADADTAYFRVVPKRESGVKIMRVIPNQRPTEINVRVEGRLNENLPENEQLWLFYKDIDDTKAITQYFPQSEVQYDNAEKTSWKGTVRIGGHPSKAHVMVARVGESGRKLCQYYSKVVQETGKYPSIVELTKDIIECDCQEIILK